ncbi:MAG: UDP-N-acetylglucosamine--N-acetylmuramyl-(pentapeptide) pyrophosphoryl-undecaprenol [Candidatus Saccharibacteria bacterium]|nr:UDP-N-acetylglucosamine--N-acetylmuramyl-(pentapeptide) pyrophosphoryl-undecaprenol [Candidatus Saccharibacteria bacterium]
MRELKTLHPNIHVRFWTDKGFALEAHRIVSDYDPSIKFQTVLSGKFRRYHHLSRLQHLTIPSVVFPNILDGFKVFLGTIQSFFRLLFWRPNVVFLKGGFVCVPVGIAAWLLRIPIVIHDSDAHPGLANRILAPMAKRITTGVSLDHYNYPPEKSAYVGIPIDSHFVPLPEKKRQEVKLKFGFDPKRTLTVFVGGGQGSKQINDNVALHLIELVKITNVMLLSGTKQYDELRSLTPPDNAHFRIEAFIPPQGMAELLGAADIVVTRAGASALLELAALSKPTIVIPSKRLVWQVKHAKLYVDMQAVYPIDEDHFTEEGDQTLVHAVKRLVTDQNLADRLAKNLHRLARPNASRDMAATIMSATRKKR